MTHPYSVRVNHMGKNLFDANFIRLYNNNYVIIFHIQMAQPKTPLTLHYQWQTIDDDGARRWWKKKKIQHNTTAIFLTRIKICMCHNVIHLWPINTNIDRRQIINNFESIFTHDCKRWGILHLKCPKPSNTDSSCGQSRNQCYKRYK